MRYERKWYPGLLLLSFFLLCPLAGGEELLWKLRESDYTLDTETHGKSWKNVYSRSFYFPAKIFNDNRNSVFEFRAEVVCKAGSSPLRSALRLCTNPGNKLRATKTFPALAAVKDKNVPFVCRFTVPDLDGTFVNPNIQIAVLQSGNEHCRWELKNVRLIKPREQTVKSVLESVGPASSGVEAARFTKPLTLVSGGKCLFTIVIPDKKSVLYDYAAEELQTHFKLVTGAQVPVVKESAFKGGPAIYIGDTGLARKYGLSPDILPPELAAAVRFGDKIILSGGDTERPVYRKTLLSRASIAVGTLYAAYEFIERVLGVRWFWPGKNGTWAPAKKEIAVGRLHVFTSPANNTRTLFYDIPNDPDLQPGDIGVWQRRCRFGGSVGSPIANHAFRDWHRKFPDHPEYFALQPDGTRKVNAEQGVHLCFRNPDVLKEAVKEKIAELKKNDYSIFAAVMTGDSDPLFHCRCPLCINDAKTDRNPEGRYSDAMWGFVNKVAREVGKAVPGKFIKCCAYSEYKEPPTFPLEGNVAVTLCLGGAPHGSKLYRSEVVRTLKQWRNSGAALYRWEYWNNTRFKRGVYGAPAVYPRQLKELYALDRGIVKGRVIELCNYDSNGVDTRNWTDWIYDVQNLYLGAKLMWDPDTDVEKLLDEYYDGFFGPAGKTLRQFHDEMELAYLNGFDWRKSEWNYELCWQKVYPAPFVDRMMGLLRRAVTECKGREPYAGRAAKLLKGYLPFERNSRIYRKAKKSENPLNITLKRNGSEVTIGNFADSYNINKPTGTTAMTFSVKDGFFRAKVVCTIPPEHKEINWAKPGVRDSYLWEKESVEFFFYGGAPEDYYQFILGPENALSDFHYTPETKQNAKGWISALGWNCENAKWTAKRTAKGWEGELVLPLKCLKFKTPNPDGSFKVNFCRNHYYRVGEERKFRWEQSCWQPTFGAFSDIRYYGTMAIK
ncbi:MAG: DUF4838 domain-containing protein [Lentisphaeria bacterium]|nr:DUF4838 domain-containing protein [Lentisphaeria bacterium]